MHRLLLLSCSLFISIASFSAIIIVKNIDELKEAEKKAQPGDIIVFQNGEWKDVTIKLNCKGTKAQPVKFKAADAGKVIISGNSQLRIGGEYIIVEGLLFTNGHAGDDPVISFRSGKDDLANNCRVTQCVIDNFNNPRRMDENYWIAFYGKNNRLDHCSFRGKTNMGVLLAVILDDDRSRENFHLIDRNYFGRRVPLASNGGEIIRVGVSQHCQFNSNTIISNNFFEHCDGETEIVSIKSCSNKVEKNIFKECQGSVVLRHGDNNLVSGNYFLGNDKPGTGGVRIINKGQVVTSNIFYKCRGVDFRSPMAIMNGIPNSPANRYVQVTDATVASNIFYECSPIALCEGSDTERTLPPDNVKFSDNTFYNTKDTSVYRVSDDINGFHFTNNKVSKQVKQVLANGFIKTTLPFQLKPAISTIPSAEKNTYRDAGASWFVNLTGVGNNKAVTINCANANDIIAALARKENDIIIVLTGSTYWYDKLPVITKNVTIRSNKKKPIFFASEHPPVIFVLGANANLTLDGLILDGSKGGDLVSSSGFGHSAHYNFTMKNCSVTGFDRYKGSGTVFRAGKDMVADSIVIRNCSFYNNTANIFMLTEEKDDKGYYNAEKIIIANNKFDSLQGILLAVYRGGNDESTLGPNLSFTNNTIINCSTVRGPLISLTGVQVTNFKSNTFRRSNTGDILIRYTDTVRARHSLQKNILISSGSFEKNQFVVETGTVIK